MVGLHALVASCYLRTPTIVLTSPMGSVGYLVRHFFALGQEVTSPANQGQSTKSFDQVKMETNPSN